MKILGKDSNIPAITMVIEDLFQALISTENMSLTVVPDVIKQSVEQALYKLKAEVAELAFSHFEINDFEPTPEIIQIMREVVSCHYGGE